MLAVVNCLRAVVFDELVTGFELDPDTTVVTAAALDVVVETIFLVVAVLVVTNCFVVTVDCKVVGTVVWILVAKMQKTTSTIGLMVKKVSK